MNDQTVNQTSSQIAKAQTAEELKKETKSPISQPQVDKIEPAKTTPAKPTVQPQTPPQPASQPVKPQMSAQPQTPPQPAGQPANIAVLLIEDDLLLSKMYQTKLVNEGFQVLMAGDGEEGLKMALEQKVDFIILDVMMPKLSGIDFLKKLREDPKGQTIPVIVLSNLSQQGQAQEALSLGAKEFLIKANLTPTQIIAKVRQYLGK